MATATVDIPSMTPTVVQDYLREIGRQWTGQGMAMELGCWMGASSVPLLEGLVEAGYNKEYWAFDKWKANATEVQKSRRQGLRIKEHENIQPIFLHNVRKVYPHITAVRGRIPNILKHWRPGPIEMCMFDAPKRNPVFSGAVNKLLPHFIPGVTVFGLLDYYFYKSKPKDEQDEFLAPVRFIRRHEGCFELMAEFPDNGSCVFFKYVKQCTKKPYAL